MKDSKRKGRSPGGGQKTAPHPVNTSKPGSSGIKEIARAAGVSIGTVDRALHSRPGISAATRARIMVTAEKLGYRPNLAARYLKLSHRRTVAVLLPQEIASYFDPLRAGIRQAAEKLQPKLQVVFHSYPSLGRGDVAALQKVLEQPCDGLILTPGSLSKMTPLIRQATARGTAVVCVATDAPGVERLTAIASDAFTGGAIAAELLMRVQGGAGEVAVMTGDLAVFDHSEKVRGFRAMLAELGSPAALVAVDEAHDDHREAYRQTCDLLQRRPNLSGIYVSTANSLPVIEALEKKGCLDRVAVVTTDLFPEMIPLIRAGKVLATLYQRPTTQGRMAFEALYRFLMEGVRPPPIYKLYPHIVLRSNLDLFVESAGLKDAADEA